MCGLGVHAGLEKNNCREEREEKRQEGYRESRLTEPSCVGVCERSFIFPLAVTMNDGPMLCSVFLDRKTEDILLKQVLYCLITGD